MVTQTVLYDVQSGVANITLNRPNVVNAFDEEMHAVLFDVLGDAAIDDDVRCIVLKGSGKGFSSGADLSVVDEENLTTFDHGDFLRKTYNRLLLRMMEVEKPIVASIHGPAFGAGLSVALACDFRIAAESSSLSLAFIKIGLMPDAGSCFFLPRIVGLSRAMELAALGDTIKGEEACRIGLVNRVVSDEQLDLETRSFAERLAHLPTKALARIKQTMYRSFETDLSSMLEREAAGQAAMGKTRDHLEGVQAFYEKRKPQFIGR